MTVGLAAAAVTAFAVCYGGLEPWMVQGYQRGGTVWVWAALRTPVFGPVLGLAVRGVAAEGVLGLQFPPWRWSAGPGRGAW